MNVFRLELLRQVCVDFMTKGVVRKILFPSKSLSVQTGRGQYYCLSLIGCYGCFREDVRKRNKAIPFSRYPHFEEKFHVLLYVSFIIFYLFLKFTFIKISEHVMLTLTINHKLYGFIILIEFDLFFLSLKNI